MLRLAPPPWRRTR